MGKDVSSTRIFIKNQHGNILLSKATVIPFSGVFLQTVLEF